ncbi:MAG: division/cell wall cluster transcriptional repressor MraZ, partial [Planctomycetia bacterium]
MLLTGTHERTLDEKKRLALPRKIRETMRNPELVFISPGPDQCLWLFTQENLESLAARLDNVPATDAEARVFRRLYFAQTES